MGRCLWRVIVVLSTLFLNTAQHGVFKKPSSVNGCYHGQEGTFFWTIAGGNVYLNITASIKDDEWVAIAFSNDTLMGNDDVVAVFMDQFSDSSRFVATSLLDPYRYKTTKVQELDSIVTSSITYKNGKVEANITKSIEDSYPFDTLDKTPVYLFFGKGRVRLLTEANSETEPLHMHYENPSISRNLIDLNYKKLQTCINTQTNKLIQLHGILMVLVWLNFTPLAVYIARYAKYYFKKQTLWFTIHKYTGILSGVLFIAAVCAAYTAVKELELEQHQIVGMSVLLVLLVHIIMALCRPSHEARYRRLWEILHKITAGLLFIGSFTNIVNGLHMVKAHESCYWAITGQIIAFCAIFIMLENPYQVTNWLGRVCVCLRISPHLYYSLNNQFKDDNSDTDGDDITMVTMELDNTGSRSAFVTCGLWTIIIINSIVSVTIVSALANT